MREEVEKKITTTQTSNVFYDKFCYLEGRLYPETVASKNICNAFGFTVLEVTYSKLDVPSNVYSSFLSAKKGMKAEWIQY